jgi:hypothetical protein
MCFELLGSETQYAAVLVSLILSGKARSQSLLEYFLVTI